jgi:hypothetical protein
MSNKVDEWNGMALSTRGEDFGEQVVTHRPRV